MQVDVTTFSTDLFGLVVNIADADFVAFDFELTGIPSRLPDKDKPPRGSGRNTLEERYAEAKLAADRYQILQIGITCAKHDHQEDAYVLRPYNITISPLLHERLDIEREFSCQSGALSFLLQHQFDIAKPFVRGVQYFSREEAHRAKKLAWDRVDNKNHFADIDLKEDEKESLDFVRRVKKSISIFEASEDYSTEITSHVGLEEHFPQPTISRLEKRLVHQVVRANFPDLVAVGQAQCVRILRFDAMREAENVRRIKTRVKEQIARQIGFRWIIEALAQDGDLDGLRSFIYDKRYSERIEAYGIKIAYIRALETLKTTRPVLVGHNLFTDLVYLYRTFVGPLPDTLQSFRDELHKLFPKIVDTKFLATHTEGDLYASPSLEEIAKRCKNHILPKIKTHAEHSRYNGIEACHEAGYDSLLTATIMLRLSTQIKSKQNGNDSSPSNPLPRGENAARTTNGSESSPGELKHTLPARSPTNHVQALFQPVLSKSTKKGKKSIRTTDETKGKFHSQNLFDALRNLDVKEKSETDLDKVESMSRHVEDTFKVSNGYEDDAEGKNWWEAEPWAQDKVESKLDAKPRQDGEVMPSFDSDFWKEFGNQVRVFGTQEAVLTIAEW